MPSSRGVYFLANDRVLDLAIAFLNSFRRYNPEIPLCLVPFDENFDEVCDLRSKYVFSVFSDAIALQRCDELSKHFAGHRSGQFRKLAIWEGVFDEFIYIDVDTVVLSDIDF